MENKIAQRLEQLKTEYLELVKRGLNIQKTGDILAYKMNALKAETLAQKIQSISRDQL